MLKRVDARSDMALKPRVIGWLAGNLVRLLTKTLKVNIRDDSGILSQPPEHGVIWMFWHNRLLIIPSLYSRHTRRFREGAVLTSASGDGAMLAAVMRQFGLEAVRGSSSKRGAQALIECCRLLRRNHYIGITPDGPRGPVYQMQPGAVQLAKVGRAPILPVRVEYARAWRLKSWDRFFIPHPFSEVHIHLLPLVRIESDDLEGHCAVLTKMLEPVVP
ncbi:MAG: lysophospholipid acyltransferase family protein [Verrucomicrobiota bacterium]